MPLNTKNEQKWTKFIQKWTPNFIFSIDSSNEWLQQLNNQMSGSQYEIWLCYKPKRLHNNGPPGPVCGDALRDGQ